MEMQRPVIALFCMPEDGHFKLLRPLISDLTNLGFTVYVFTHRRFESAVRQRGGAFVDLFAKYPLEIADAESIPVPCRFVTFAGVYAEEIVRDLEQIRPSLIVYETFAVIGPVAAAKLGIPSINVSPCHNMDPARFLALLRNDSRVKISPACHRAVERLRQRHGLADASPFSYVSGLSPFLNIYCEPANYLTEQERRVFEPVAFYGSLPSIDELEAKPEGHSPSYFGKDESRLKIYISFGTVIWRYYAAEALSTLKAFSEGLEDRPDVCALISLGGAALENDPQPVLSRPNVRIENYVDQWKVLREADLFVTHHGLNSTHEAIFHRVPMLSYPFFVDQPMLAEKCQGLGLAFPLADTARGPVRRDDVRRALDHYSKNKESLGARLDEAHDWERDVVMKRKSVLQRIKDLA